MDIMTFSRGRWPLTMRRLFGASAVAAALAVAPVALGASPAAAQSRAAVASTNAEIAAFYRSRGGAPLWFSSRSGAAAQQFIQLLATAHADNLNPRRYNVRALTRAVQDASRGNPAAIQRAETLLSQAFVAYARDIKRDPNVGIIYVDPELRPAPPSARALLGEAAAAPSLARFVGDIGWMNPIYAKLRQALASRMYRSEAERRLLAINLERARALPSGRQRYVIVNAPAARLYIYENGEVVDSMRVVAGKPAPASKQTPMMNALIRFVVLNPYWNAPSDVAAENLAPNVLKRGAAYLKEKGYEVMSDWSDNARVISPASVNWQAVAARREQVRLRQRPGPANSMGLMKFMFPNSQGIWLHDTPVKEKIEEAGRLQSAGCVRLEDAPRFARWLFGRPLKAQGARPEQQVPLPQPVPLFITYLTAVPSGSSIVYFDDFYGKDRQAMQRIASR